MKKFTMKSGLAALVMATASALAGTSAKAWDGLDHRITIVNRTFDYVVKFLASPVYSGVFNRKRDQYMRGVVLAPGGRVKVNINFGDYCHYDLRAILSDGTTIERDDFNVCKKSSWTVID